MKQPITRYRPQKVSDGQGDSTESLVSPVTIWGIVVQHEEGMLVRGVHVNEDVQVDDILQFES